MKPVKFTTMLLLGAVSLSACTDQVTNPIEPAMRSMSESGEVQATGKYIVMFGNQRIAKSFAGDVAKLGGTVDASYDAIGVAVVAGLSDAAAASLRSLNNVANVEADVVVQWLDPVTDLETASVEDVIQATANPAGA
ncbi:MAG: hypothetical protein H0U67_03060, partial [Gemmatimonadetes bacterium]|nr:hypothetical protein [Gemmatimonadota bacterium]